MAKWRFAGAALVFLLATQARALTVAGWEVDPKPDKDGDCTLARAYKDKNDGDAGNTVVLVFAKDNDGSALMSITFGYEKWNRKKGDIVKADLVVDDTVEQRAVSWNAASPTLLVGVFRKPDDFLQSIARAGKLAVRYKESGKSDGFSTPDIAQAIGAATVCRSLGK